MKIKSKSMRKKSVAILAGVAIAGAVGASAASLGGIGGDSLGADAEDVSSCDTTGITIDYVTSFDATAGATTGGAGEYVVSALTVSDVMEACDGLDFALTLSDDANAVLASSSNTTVVLTDGPDDVDPVTLQPVPTADNASFDVTLDATVSAESIYGVALVISGSTV